MAERKNTEKNEGKPATNIPCLDRIHVISVEQIRVLDRGDAEAHELSNLVARGIRLRRALLEYYQLELDIKTLCDLPYPIISCRARFGGICDRLNSRLREREK